MQAMEPAGPGTPGTLHPKVVAVFGPGLMGGSLALALPKVLPGVKVRVWARRPEKAQRLGEGEAVEMVTADPVLAAQGADVVVLCTPVETMEALAREMAPVASPGMLVTDVGSVKAPVVQTLTSHFQRHGNFVGSHPMCGSEQAGLGAARADLYHGAVCVLTPQPSVAAERLAQVRSFWSLLGCRLLELSPEEHDRAAALVSHVPHVAAAALVELLAGENPSFAAMCAGGFRDTTRVASGSPELWSGILRGNREAVVPVLDKLAAIIDDYRACLTADDESLLRAKLAGSARRRADITGGGH